MKIIIDIPEEELELYMEYGQSNIHRIISYIADGILVDKVTNGDILKSIFCNDKDWWNSLYKWDSLRNIIN